MTVDPSDPRLDDRGSPYAPHTESERAAMLSAVGADAVEDLFDVPEPVAFDGRLDIQPREERTVRRAVESTLDRTHDLVELLGRGHYDHYVPSVVDHLADRSEFLTSYTQYQPEVQQGFLQALFEYQSLLVELTGLGVANCSMYDAATALGEAARMAARVADSRRYDACDGHRVLVPDALYEGRRAVLENYVDGAGLTVDSYPTSEGTVDVEGLREAVDEATLLVYAETPSPSGTIEPALSAVGQIADDAGALFCLGSDPVALSVLEPPAAVGADVVVGEAGVLGLPAGYGTGLGLFATREQFLRQVPGRLVGASTDEAGRRTYTLTLQTREQHIRRERATSNICTNQAWVALRAAIHAAWLGPDGLVDLASRSIDRAESLADRLDDLPGVTAPAADGRQFREFTLEVDPDAVDLGAAGADGADAADGDTDAATVADELRAAGYAVHLLDDRLQVCVTGVSDDDLDGFVAAFEEVVA